MPNLKKRACSQNTIASVTNIKKYEIEEDTSVEVDEFIKQNPTIKMIVSKVPKSDLNVVGYIKSEQINNIDTAEYKSATPFEYARQTGVQMIFPNLESYKYILQSDHLQPSYNLPLIEETVGEFEYDFDEGIL